MKLNSLIIGFVLIFTRTYGQDKLMHNFPNDFNERAYSHIETLSSFGLRTAQSGAEILTTEYLKKFMTQNSIEIQIDSFDYKMFNLDSVSVEINNIQISPKAFFINPYINQELYIDGFTFVLDSTYDWYWKQNLENKIVICSSKSNPYRLSFHRRKPMSVIQLKQPDFDLIQGLDEIKVAIKCFGFVNKYKTLNFISTINSSQTEEIILTAHWDSYNGPGAADNASGISVLLETLAYLSKIKDSIPFKISVVFFGAEELGLLGSKSFVVKYAERLLDCKYIINVDNVGGSNEIGMEMRGGVRNQPPKGNIKIDSTLLFYAQTDLNGKWRLIYDSPYMSNVPDWLKSQIEETSEELDIPITPLNQIGSDHQSFYLAGIPATSIVKSRGSKIHCKEDTPEQINIDGLEKIGKIITLMILNTNKN